jgi:flavin reductase (DIM6/NTAB) family NADH-FMN oxidoreductase RutF
MSGDDDVEAREPVTREELPPGKATSITFPRLTVLATCQAPGGRPNAITLSWHSPISIDPPLYGISVAFTRASHGMIQESKEFVVNFLPYRLAEEVHFCGRNSGRDTDKFSATGLTAVPSKVVAPPAVGEAYAALECRLFESTPLGDHTWFTGEVISAWRDPAAFSDSLLTPTLEPLLYMGRNTYAPGGAARRGF